MKYKNVIKSHWSSNNRYCWLKQKPNFNWHVYLNINFQLLFFHRLNNDYNKALIVDYNFDNFFSLINVFSCIREIKEGQGLTGSFKLKLAYDTLLYATSTHTYKGRGRVAPDFEHMLHLNSYAPPFLYSKDIDHIKT